MRDEALYIEEWLAFHLLQGATQILIYDNGSTDGTRELLAQASTSAPVTVIEWTNRPGHFDDIQRAAYMDGAKRLSESCEWVAFIDADEFLHSGSAETVAKALAAFSEDISAIAVNQRVFGSGGKLTYELGLVTERFTSCNLPDYEENRWFKTIARPNRIVAFDSVHSVILNSGRYAMNDGEDVLRETNHPGLSNRVGTGALTVNHYSLRSLEEFHQKQRRWQFRPEMQERYTIGYFTGRERIANLASDERLLAWSDLVKARIEALRNPAPAAQQQPVPSPMASRLLSNMLSGQLASYQTRDHNSRFVARLLNWLRRKLMRAS